MYCKRYRHPLIHNGTHQNQRLNPALLPGSVNMDDRTVADIFGFIHELAGLFKYFDHNNQHVGDWKCFFENEPLCILSIIVSIDLSQYDEAYCEAEVEFWKEDAEATSVEDARAKRTANYQILIDKIYQLALIIYDICEWVQRARPEMPLRKEILDIIDQQILNAIFENRQQNALEQLIAYDKGSEPPATQEKYSVFVSNEEGTSPSCTRIWDIVGEDGYYCILADDGFKEQQLPGACKENRKLRQLFVIFFQALFSILDRAKVYLRKMLTETQTNEPHLSLFFSFLFVLKYLQGQFRRLTQRHLDYYYVDVLGLSPLPFTPDQAFVLLELATNFKDFVLKTGTLFDAAKDSKGDPLRYFLNTELVVNKSSIESLKTVYLQEGEKEYKLYASPVANSLDGRGLPFADEESMRWRSLGDVEDEGVLNEMGFAIASPEFTLREGERYVELKLSFEENEDGTTNQLLGDLSELIEYVEYSTTSEESEWYKFSKKDKNGSELGLNVNVDTDFKTEKYLGAVFNASSPAGSTDLVFKMLIAPDAPPVDIPRSSETPLINSSRHPLMKFLFAISNEDINYQLLKALRLTKLHVRVGVRGVRTLILQSGSGIFENTQPFPAFGMMRAGTLNTNPLYIGSDEVFRKNINGRLDLFIQQLNTPGISNLTIDNANVNLLENRVFEAPVNFSVTNNFTITSKEVPYYDIDPAQGPLIKISQPAPGLQTIRSPHAPLEPFGFQSINGFVRTRLDYTLTATGGFGPIFFPQFQNFFMNYVAERITFTDSGEEVNEELKEQVFHLLPFGFNETKNTILDPNVDAGETEPPETSIPLPIIPPFSPPVRFRPGGDPNSATLLAGGNLYIGIKDLIPGQSLSFLFKVLEGSGNPEFTPPDIQWSYLRKNPETETGFIWKEFAPEDIVQDGTRTDPASARSLIRTGIIQFNTSKEIVLAPTNIDPEQELYWIRASAVEDPANNVLISALPDLVAVHAQAAMVTFINNGNSLEHLGNVLPKQSISKLTERKTQIRKVEQPYASFNGRPVELPIPFYRRSSERLRHKNRSVTLWDYERLLLQAFPEIRQAKCITHSRPGCEIDPGYVMVAVFPDLRNRNNVNQTEPGFGTGELEAMETFLRNRVNLFLFCGDRLQVVNPLYELLRVKCCIRFRAGFLPVKYAEILNEDLKLFLAPWTTNSNQLVFFSNEFHTSTLLNFIEERIYVDKVFEFEVFHYIKDAKTGIPASQHWGIKDVEATEIEIVPVPVSEEIIPSTSARSIFTSFTSSTDELDHEILIWKEDGCKICTVDEFTQFDSCNNA